TRERLQLVVNELNHRVKNTLATVQSIAQHTFSRANPEAYEAFEARLLSLASIHDALTREGWIKASLSEIVGRATSCFGGDRFLIEGPVLD
ncbi:HWE histidine kinase domain-containing protein, partial [Acinetobacter baumannii]